MTPELIRIQHTNILRDDSQWFWAYSYQFSNKLKVKLFPSELFLMVNLSLLQVNNSLEMPPKPIKLGLSMSFLMSHFARLV